MPTLNPLHLCAALLMVVIGIDSAYAQPLSAAQQAIDIYLPATHSPGNTDPSRA